ncbi:MAG: hypothetical protein KIT69_06255 [Propionibacteriaceae bacterium]|nr:hypothetical protein [Propionibacteriaceae bacterium]
MREPPAVRQPACDPRGMGDDLGPLLPIGWEWIAVNLAVFVLLVVAAVVTAILLHRNRRRNQELPRGGRPAISPVSLEARLIELDGLLVQGRITGDEYTAMRSRILDLQ